jgi:hypothetical protein
MIGIVSWALELKRSFCLGCILCRKEEGLDGRIVEDEKLSAGNDDIGSGSLVSAAALYA